MNPNQNPAEGIGTSERRQATRIPSQQQVSMRLEFGVVEGQTQNISAEGLNFFADSPLDVNIQVQTGESVHTVPGRVVRLESVTESRIGIAVRFKDRLDLEAMGIS